MSIKANHRRRKGFSRRHEEPRAAEVPRGRRRSYSIPAGERHDLFDEWEEILPDSGFRGRGSYVERGLPESRRGKSRIQPKS